MKKNSYILLIAIITLLLSACQKEIEFDEKLIQPRLVINSFIAADSLIDVKVSASKSIPGLEKTFPWPDDATVKLFVDGIETETLEVYYIEAEETPNDIWFYYDNTKPTCGYRSVSTKAETGRNYRLEVTHDDYDMASAETFLPHKPEIINIKTEDITENYYGQDLRGIQVTLRFKDVPNEKNYYRLNISTFTGNWFPNFDTKDDTTGVIQLSHNNIGNVSSSDKLLNQNEEDANDFLFGSPGNAYNLFTDDLIDGKEYELTFSIYPNNNTIWYNGELMVFGEKPGEFYQITIQLQTITKDAYLYMRSSYAQRWYGNDFFSEPVQVYSNIENGVGIFAGFNPSMFEISKGEYPVEGIEYREDYY
jgi:hypothetical protein